MSKAEPPPPGFWALGEGAGLHAEQMGTNREGDTGGPGWSGLNFFLILKGFLLKLLFLRMHGVTCQPS